MSCRSGRARRCIGWAARVSPSLVLVFAGGCDRRSPPRQFDVTFPQEEPDGKPIDGRLLVMLSTDPSREPPFQINNNVPVTQQIFGIDVDGLAPGGRAHSMAARSAILSNACSICRPASTRSRRSSTSMTPSIARTATSSSSQWTSGKASAGTPSLEISTARRVRSGSTQ